MRYESIFQQLVYVQVFKVTVTKAYRTFHFACFCLTVSLSLSDGQRQLISAHANRSSFSLILHNCRNSKQANNQG